MINKAKENRPLNDGEIETIMLNYAAQLSDRFTPEQVNDIINTFLEVLQRSHF